MKLIDVIQYLLYAGAPVGQSMIVAIMIFRRLFRDYPVFFAYSIFHVAHDIATIVLTQFFPYKAYFWFYWSCEAVDALFAFAVINEVFEHVFRDYTALQRLGGVLFRWAAVVLIMIAVISAASASGTDSNRMIAGLVVLQRSVSFVKCGLLFFLFLFCRYFGLTWRNLTFGIGVGMGLTASIVTAVAALQSQLGASLGMLYVVAPGAAYNISVLVWVVYTLAPERRTTRVAIPDPNELHNWNLVLTRILSR